MNREEICGGDGQRIGVIVLEQIGMGAGTSK